MIREERISKGGKGRPCGEGVDGLNLVEFPLSVLSDRPPSDRKTLEFEETESVSGTPVRRRLTITGSDKFGLPCYKHHDLLVALIQLTKEKNGFASPRVEFTRYELLEKLGWDDSGHYYALAKNALCIWKGVTLLYEDAWWVDGVFRTKAISVIDEFELYGTRGGARRTKAELVDCPSYIVWGDVVFAEFRDRRTKGLDYEFYLSLGSSVAKQLYRHLDKWFHFGRTFRHDDLRTFACEKIGLSRKHDNSNLMRELERGLSELEARGYLKAQPRDVRFPRVGRGHYRVCLERAAAGRIRTRGGVEEGLQTELTRRGVRDVAGELVSTYPEAKIRRAIKNFDERQAAGEEVTAGFLVSDIRSERGFAFRRGRKTAGTKASRAACPEQEAEKTKRQASLEEAAAKACEAEQSQVEAFFAGLESDFARKQFETRALAVYRFRPQLERAREVLLSEASDEERSRASETYSAHRAAALKAFFRKVRAGEVAWSPAGNRDPQQAA